VILKPLKYRLEILSVGCILLGIGIWVKFSWGYARFISDFSQDYVAARSLRCAAPLYPESPSTVVDEETTIEDIPNYHPPFNAILFLPFSYFPYKAAFKLWNLVNFALYVFLIFLILRNLNILNRTILLQSSFLFLWYPFITTVGLGQLSIVLSILIVGAYFLIASRRETAGAICLGLATMIKLFPGFLIFYFLLLRKWYGAIVMLTTIAAGMLLTWMIVGSENFFVYFTQVIPADNDLWVTFPLNVSLPGFLSLLLSDTLIGGRIWGTPLFNLGKLGRHIAAAIPLILSIPIVVLLFREMEKKRDAESLFALLLLTMLLVSPLTWWHMVIVTLILFGIVLRDYREGKSVPTFPAVIAALLLSLPFVQIIRLLVDWYHPNPVPWYASLPAKSYLYGLIILWILFWKRMKGGFVHSSKG